MVCFSVESGVCNPPTPPNNGSVGNYPNISQNGETFIGATVEYQCNELLKPVAVMTSVCSTLGTWYPPPEQLECVPFRGKQTNMHGLVSKL